MIYYKRHIDSKLLEWKNEPRRKPLLIRGARQVGKSTAVRELGKSFTHFVEINLEKQPDLVQLFTENIDVKKTCEKLSGTLAIPIIPGETLLFIDEIQVSKEAVMALRSNCMLLRQGRCLSLRWKNFHLLAWAEFARCICIRFRSMSS